MLVTYQLVLIFHIMVHHKPFWSSSNGMIILGNTSGTISGYSIIHYLQMLILLHHYGMITIPQVVQ